MVQWSASLTNAVSVRAEVLSHNLYPLIFTAFLHYIQPQLYLSLKGRHSAICKKSSFSTVTRYNKKYLVSMCLQEHSWMCVIQTQTSYMCFCIMSRPVVLACGDVLSGSMCTYMVHWWVSASLPVCWSLHQNEWNMTGTALLSGPFTLMMYSIVAWAVFVWRGWTGSLTFSSRRLWYK